MIIEKFAPLALLIGSLVSFVCYKCWQVAKVRKENQKLTAKNHQLEMEKSVAETQVKNFEVRKQNEENISSTSRDGIIERLHANKDLRD